MAHTRSFFSWISVTVLFSGCGLSIDYEPVDAAAADAAPGDAGSGLADASPGDAGPLDAGPLDAGTTSDASTRFDAGSDSGPPCIDLDGDGVTTCAGDCDDGDPTVYPGGPLICGDARNNDCSGAVADSECGGLGTFVAVPPDGSDANAGTQSSPVATIGRALMNAQAIGMGVDVYVSTGTYDESFGMIEGTSVLGGHAFPSWARDTTTRTTRIRTTRAAGIVFPAGITRATELSGFTVQGASATAGGANTIVLTIMADSSPLIRDNDLFAGASAGASYVVQVNQANAASSGSPRIESNTLRLAQSATGWASNQGSFGVRAWQSAIEIVGNQFQFVNVHTHQRAVELFSGIGSLVHANVVRGGGNADVAFGIRIGGGSATIDSNDIALGNCGTYCVGIELAGDLTNVEVTDNIAFGGDGSQTSYGLALAFEGLPATTPSVLVHSSFFSGGSGGGSTAGIYLGERPTAPLVIGRFYDNIVHSGTGTTRYAVRENHPNFDPEIFRSNALTLDASGGMTAGAIYLDEGSLPIAVAITIDALFPTGSGNRNDDCDVIDARPGGDFHLDPSSSCIDAGDASEAPPLDFEGDARVQGAAPDIGVDEVR